MITVRVQLTARRGKRIELEQAIDKLKDKITIEKGCSHCRIYQNIDNRNQFVILQEWENQQLARAHLDSENFAVMVGASSVLAHEVSASLGKHSSIDNLEKSFNERLTKKQ